MGGVDALQYAKAIAGSLHFNTLYNNHPCYVVAQQKQNTMLKKIKYIVSGAVKRSAIKKRNKIKIITFVRNPYSRNMHSFFYDFGYWMYEYSCKTRADQRAHSSVEIVISAFDKLFNKYYVLEWFDKELKRFTGIDVYNNEFDKNKGWSIIQKDKYEVLIVQVEKIYQAYEVINAFANTDKISYNAQAHSAKWYDDIFKDFEANYIPAENYLDTLYTSKYAENFYNKEQLEYFKNAAGKAAFSSKAY